MSRQGGFLTIEQVAVAALGLVLLTWAANLVVFQYARAVTRLAIDEGVRAGVVVPAELGEQTCMHTATDALADLVRGPIGDSISVTCSVSSSHVRASATGVVVSWVPGISSFVLDAEAVAPRPTALP